MSDTAVHDQFTNEENLLKRLNPDLFLIFRAMKAIERFGGNGSIEIHFVHTKIKDNGGIYIKPGFDMGKLIGPSVD